MPSPSRGRAAEEQKRANSVASGDTIVSTTSSNSPLKQRPLYMKKNLQQMGLQVTGQQAGRGVPNSLQKYSKYPGNRQSPYVSKAGLRNQSSKMRGTGASNTDSELYGNQPSMIANHSRPGPTGIGQGSKNISLSRAQRQQENREK